jgi:hypothetical protein
MREVDIQIHPIDRLNLQHHVLTHSATDRATLTVGSGRPRVLGPVELPALNDQGISPPARSESPNNTRRLHKARRSEVEPR